MADEKSRKIAPAVVLAQHGNKGACREVYLQYYRKIFFICVSMTGDPSLAGQLTGEIFVKMFSSVDKLSDYKAFEPWFFSLAVNLCRSHAPENQGDSIIGAEIPKLAAEAAQALENQDAFAFEHTMRHILQEMIFCLPGAARVLFFYRYMAGLSEERIAALEKIEAGEVSAQLNALDILLKKQTEQILQLGVDMTGFLVDLPNTLDHLAEKMFVPDSVPNAVSEAVGIDVDPFLEEKKAKAAQEIWSSEEQEEPVGKKKLLTKSDIILFFLVIAAALLIFSSVKFYKHVKSANAASETTTASSAAQSQTPLVWNGAAASSFAAGSGTKEDPYLIANGGQLAYLANLVQDGSSYYASCCYQLSADIVLNDTQNFASWDTEAPANQWMPIGYSNSSEDHSYFCGTFDGNGHSVIGMYIAGGKDYAGFFGVIRNGTVKNLTLEYAYVEGGSYAGGIAGYFASDASAQSGFYNCAFSGILRAGGNNAGGITGYFRAEGSQNMPAISACAVSGSISSAKGYAGGIAGVGEATSGSVKMIDCMNTAQVSAAGKNAGGIAGALRASESDAILINCYNAGTVSVGGQNLTAGGIAGGISCASGSGKVNVSYCVMLDSSAALDVVKEDGGDRLVVLSVQRLTKEQMLEQDNYETFNFTDIWEFREDSLYPYPVLKALAYEPFLSVEEPESGSDGEE